MPEDALHETAAAMLTLLVEHAASLPKPLQDALHAHLAALREAQVE